MNISICELEQQAMLFDWRRRLVLAQNTAGRNAPKSPVAPVQKIQTRVHRIIGHHLIRTVAATTTSHWTIPTNLLHPIVSASAARGRDNCSTGHVYSYLGSLRHIRRHVDCGSSDIPRNPRGYAVQIHDLEEECIARVHLCRPSHQWTTNVTNCIVQVNNSTAVMLAVTM